MVRKAKLCEWFKALPAHKRVDYMCGLLHMCHPLELRFTGTVLEDLAKKDFHYLREQEFKANQRADLSSNNSNSLSDQKLRAKIITALALMNSTNLPCAEVIFEILHQQFENMLSMLSDAVQAADLIMILTMAVHHPAFTFYQKDRLGQILERLEERLQELYGSDDEQVISQSPLLCVHRDEVEGLVRPNDPKSYADGSTATGRATHVGQVKGEGPDEETHKPAAFDDEQVNLMLPSQSVSPEMSAQPGSLNNNQSPVCPSEKATVVSIRVISAEPTQTKKGGAKYRIHTTWSNNEVTEVLLKFKQLQDLHHKILHRFPEEKRTHASVPVFPGIQAHNNMESSSDQINALNTYFSKLAKAPAHILDCDILTQPLRSGTLVYQSKPASNTPISATSTVSSSPHTQTVFIQTSPLREDRKYEFAPYHQPIMMSYSNMVPHTHCSPGASQKSSAANSPVDSRTSSPAPVSSHPGSKSNYTSPGSVKGNSGAVSGVGRSSDHISQLLHVLNLEEYLDHLKDYPFQQLRFCLNLEEYLDNLKDYPFQQVMHMSKEDFAKAGLPADAQAKLKSRLDQFKPDFNGLVDTTRLPSTQSSPAFYPPFCFHHHPYTLIAPPYPQHFIHPFTAQAGHHIALLPSPQPHIATNENSPANSDTSSPPPSPQQPLTGLLLDPSQLVSQVGAAAGSPHIMSPSAVASDVSDGLSARNTKILQLPDSSGSEEEKAAGYNQESAALRSKGSGRPQQSRSLPLISQGQLPVTTIEAARLTGMPISMSAPHSHPAIINPEHRTAMTPPLPPAPATHTAATLVNGYISDPPPVLPHAAPGVVPRALLNSRTYKTAQPAHTSLGLHKSVMNMPAPDISHPLSNLGKNGASSSSLPIHHGNLPPQSYSLGPSLASVPPTHMMGLSPVNFAANNLQPSPNQALLPDGSGAFPMLMYPRGILTTITNSAPIMTSTQSHHTGPPMNHSPSPAATAVCTDQLPAASYLADTLDPSRSDSCSHTPPAQTPVHLGSVKPQTNTAGTNSGTPSPPLHPPTPKPLGTESQPGGRAPQVIGIISGFLPPVIYPQQSHQPPPQFPNGITSDYAGWLRFPPQIASSHFPLVYGSVIPHQNLAGSFHAAPSSTGPAASTNQSHAGGGLNGKAWCYNCGLAGHKSSECHENRMENISNTFHLSYKPSEPPA